MHHVAAQRQSINFAATSCCQIAQIALRGDSFEKTGLPRLVGELIGFERLTRLRDKLVSKKIDMMLCRVDFLQRVAQQGEIPRLCAQARVERQRGFPSPREQPPSICADLPTARHGEGNSGVEFAGRLRTVIIPLRFNFDRGIENPISAR